MNITISGTGNVATVLGKKLLAAGHAIKGIYGRNPAASEALATLLGAPLLRSPAQLDPSTEMILLAVTDKAIAEVAAGFRPGIIPMLHTAGSVPMDTLKNYALHYGVLYPLQSLRKEAPTDIRIPFLVEGSDSATRLTIFSLARSLSADVSGATDEQRLNYHLAAVLVNNFNNFLWIQAEAFCQSRGIAFDKLLPMVSTAAELLQHHSPLALATGPALRNDRLTIQKHLALLHDEPELRALYDFLTGAMMKWHHPHS